MYRNPVAVQPEKSSNQEFAAGMQLIPAAASESPDGEPIFLSLLGIYCKLAVNFDRILSECFPVKQEIEEPEPGDTVIVRIRGNIAADDDDFPEGIADHPERPQHLFTLSPARHSG